MPKGIYIRTKPVWNKGKKGLQTAWNKGIPHSEETKQKLRKSHTGKKLSNLTIQKMKGRIPWNKGKTNVYSEETLNRMSRSKKGKHYSPETELKKGKDNPYWRGGIRKFQRGRGWERISRIL